MGSLSGVVKCSAKRIGDNDYNERELHFIKM